jgi:hypothetical protein
MFDILFELLKALWYCFGFLIIVAIGFHILAGGRLDVKTVLRPILHFLFHLGKLLFTCCAAVGQAVAKHVSPQYAPLVAHGVHALLIISLIAWFVCATEYHGSPDTIYNTNTSESSPSP